MADNKKYYYLKLKDNFFDTDEMIVLQNMQDGYLYSDILMKLYLRSLKNEGKLMFKDVIPYTPEVLAQVVRHHVGVVKQALDIFKTLGLVEIFDSGAIYMLDIQNFIGKSSTEADRVRLYDKRMKKEKEQLKLANVEIYKKSTPELEKELELDLEIKKDIEKKKEKNIVGKQVSNSSQSNELNNAIDYVIDKLNESANANFRKTTKGTRTLIRARLKEGFRLEDFESVINHKCNDWLNKKDFAQYLRPATLFGSKFESYLMATKQSNNSNNQIINEIMEMKELERRIKNGEI